MAAGPNTHFQKALRPLFTKQAKSFAAGVDLLRSVGFTNKQLRVLAKSSLDASDAELKRVVGKVKATDKQMNAAAKKFGTQGVTLDLGTVGAKNQRALARVGSACGTFPSAVDCATLVTAAEAAAILGGPATKADSNGCEYDGTEPAAGTKPQLGFDVYTSARAFATVTKGRVANITDIGDEAASFEGFQTFSIDNSCGTTLAVRKGEHVAVVAVCLADTNGNITSVRLGALVDLALQILARL